MSLQRTAKVRTYFTKRARLFDALYEDDNLLQRGVNLVFRHPMFTRYVYTLSAMGNLEGKRILDIGCGSGRYAVELASKGATVVGIDFSDEMLKMATQRARAAGVVDQTTFVSADFTEWSRTTSERFDVAIAMGVLDYVDDAPAFLAMIADVADDSIVSFPRPTPVRMPLRKIRYRLRGCPVHFYRRSEIIKMYKLAGVGKTEIKHLGLSGYWVHGTSGPPAPTGTS